MCSKKKNNPGSELCASSEFLQISEEREPGRGYDYGTGIGQYFFPKPLTNITQLNCASLHTLTSAQH